MAATANPDKLIEIVAALSGFDILARPPDLGEVEETGRTLMDNARLKARAVADHAQHAAVADDTGLEVVALDGAPGVYSARYAGPNATYLDNVEHLLEEMEGITDRRARFETVALVAFPDGTELSAVGAVEGTIATVPRGTGGFGYDPVFIPEGGGGMTFAEMSKQAKGAHSHRGRAFALLAQLLTERWADVAP
ncbi:MAG: RdgB/HAM1 family non-canonical purine NTP pyrophosphatase [Acidimicrobiales bacterium]